MFKQALSSILFVLSAVYFSNTYACQSNNCEGAVFGPVALSGIHDIGGKPHTVVIVEDTAITEKQIPSGADDDTCRYGDGWLVVQPMIAKYGKGTAVLDIINAGQMSTKTTGMVFYYRLNAATGYCEITSAGYTN